MTGQARLIRSVNGSIFDVAALSEISEDDCHVLFVSGRTLYLMQHFARNEVNWLSRYSEGQVSELWYLPVDLDSAETLDLVEDIARNYRLEVSMNCAEIIEAIGGLVTQLGLINTNLQGAISCGCDGDTFDHNPLDYEDVENPGEEYLEQRCRVANVLHDRIRNFAATIDTLGIVHLLNLGVGTATAIVGGLVVAGPAGWGTLLVVGVVSGILLLLNELSVGALGSLVTEMDENQDDLICALYNAADAEQARTQYLEILDGQGVNAAVQQIVAFMLTNTVTNQLFAPTGSYIGGSDWLNDGFTPTDCAGCVEDSLSFIEIGGVACGTGSLAATGALRDLVPVYFEQEDVYRLQFQVNDPARNVQMLINGVDDSGVTGWPTCRARCNPDQTEIWNHDDAGDGLGPDEETGVVFKAGNVKINSVGASFTLTIRIFPIFSDDCVI